jgi:hypothetical protein
MVAMVLGQIACGSERTNLSGSDSHSLEQWFCSELTVAKGQLLCGVETAVVPKRPRQLTLASKVGHGSRQHLEQIKAIAKPNE